MDNLPNISFHAEEISLPDFLNDSYKYWINRIIQAENHSLIAVSYIFCTDEYLLTINRQYLNHDYYTDIITFDNSETTASIESDLFISLDRVKENATELNVSFEQELKRVMIHGILHLCGYGDKTVAETEVMRRKEEEAIGLFE